MLVVHPSSQCDICARPFSEKLAPYVIPCGHIFCSLCFQEAPVKNCALCRRPYNVMKIKKLHVDFLLVDSQRAHDSEITLLRRLAEALVLGDGTYSPELSAVVEYMDRWLAVSGQNSPSEFKGLKNIRALMDEYIFVQEEYYRLHEELATLRAQLGLTFDLPPESKSSSKKPEPLELKGISMEPSRPSEFQSLIDMLKNTAWDPDLIKGKNIQRSSTTSSVASSRYGSSTGEPQDAHYVVEDIVEDRRYSPPHEDSVPLTSARMPAQYDSSWLDLRRQLARRHVIVDDSSWSHQNLPVVEEDVTPRTVRFSQGTSSHSMVSVGSDIQEEIEEEGNGGRTEEDEWGEEYLRDLVDPSSHRQLTLHILLHGNGSLSPSEQPHAPRLPTISLSPSASTTSFGAASSRSGSLSGSRLSHAVSIVTIDSAQSDNSWGTQSSVFSHMPGLRNLPQDQSNRPSRASSINDGRSILLHPQTPMEPGLRRRPAKRLRRDTDPDPSVPHGTRRRLPRSLPFLPTQDV